MKRNQQPTIINPGPQPGSWLLSVSPASKHLNSTTLRQHPSIIELSKTKDGNTLVVFDPAMRLAAMITLVAEVYASWAFQSDDPELQQLVDYANQSLDRQYASLNI